MSDFEYKCVFKGLMLCRIILFTSLMSLLQIKN
nr:MAG TPA: hypothetical protein [Caudoviricetes sp.]